MSFAAAQSHAWRLLAALDAARPLGSLCVEVRLVRVAYHYEFRLEEEGVSESFTARDFSAADFRARVHIAEDNGPQTGDAA